MIHKTAEISLRLQEPLANLLLFMLCSFSVGLTTPTKSHSHKWMFNSSVITWCCIDTCDVCKSKVHAKYCRITVLTTAKHSTLWSSASNSSYSGICIGHLLLRFLDCISDLWTAWRSGAVRRSHVWSRKMSRTRPGNKASICTCLSEANDESPVCVRERERVCVREWGLVGDGMYYNYKVVYEHELHDLRIEQLLCVSLLPRNWFPVVASKWHLLLLLQQLFMSSHSGITMLVLLTCVMQ